MVFGLHQYTGELASQQLYKSSKIPRYLKNIGYLTLGAIASFYLAHETHKSSNTIKPLPADGVYLVLGKDCPAIRNLSYSELVEMYMRSEGIESNPDGFAKADSLIRKVNPDMIDPLMYSGNIALPDINGDGKISLDYGTNAEK